MLHVKNKFVPGPVSHYPPLSANANFSVFEYLYRYAGNWKTWGQLLLKGVPSANAISSLSESFESGTFFIAEQLGIPSLFEQFWTQYGGPTQDDHPWHEFAGMRPATQEEVSRGAIWGTTESLIERGKSIATWQALPS